MTKQLKADLSLLCVTVVWGSSFFLMKDSLNSLSTFNLLAIRFIIAFLFSCIVFYKTLKEADKDTVKYGFMIGVILFAGYAIQTMGLNYTTASKSAFITGSSVVLVPLLSSMLLKSIPEKRVVFGAISAFIGLGLISLNDKLGINIGDILTFVAAIFYSFHIIAVGKYTVKVNSVALAVIQVGVVGVLSLAFSFVFEEPIIPIGSRVWLNILILSLLCTAGAFIVQNVAQKYTTPTHTALIYTAEPVFAAIFSYFLLGEVLSPRGFIGGILILLGMIVAEVDFNLFLKGFSKGLNTADKKSS